MRVLCGALKKSLRHLHISLHIRVGLSNQLRLLPLGEETPARGKSQLHAKFLQLVVGEFIGCLLVEGHTLLGCVRFGIDSVHVIVTASPFRQETVEDVLRHEAIETDDFGTRVFLFAPQVIEQYGHTPSGYRRTLVETVVCA